LRVLWPIKNTDVARAWPRCLTTKPISPQEDETMNGKLFLGLILGLIGLASAGCTSAPGVVRAQSPAGPDTAMAQGAMPSSGPAVGTPEHPCPECGCTDGTCSHCWPHHRNWSHYIRPDAATCSPHGWGSCCLGSHLVPECLPFGDHGPLVYPPNPTPGAIIQYPYYTCKGPDDFFHQGPNSIAPSR
jgi:hypothetical protein